MIRVTQLTPLEQLEKGRRRYSWRIDRAHYQNDLVEAALEYIATLEKIIQAETTPDGVVHQN